MMNNIGNVVNFDKEALIIGLFKKNWGPLHILTDKMERCPVKKLMIFDQF